LSTSSRLSIEFTPLVALLDLLTFHVCTYLALAITDTVPAGGSTVPYSHLVPVMSVLFLAVFAACGLYKKNLQCTRVDQFISILTANGLLIAVQLGLNQCRLASSIPFQVIVSAAVMQSIALTIERLLIRQALRNNNEIQHCIVVSNNEATARNVALELGRAAGRHLAIGDYCSVDAFHSFSANKMPWEAVLLTQDIEDKPAIIRRALLLGKSVYIAPDIFELWMNGAHPLEIADALMLTVAPPRLALGQVLVKRALDIAGSLSLLAITAPLIAVASVLIRLTSPGKVIFRQQRVGAAGAVFTLYKLRTMHIDAERFSGPVLASLDDPRVTPLGRFLRATRIDELPQILNVLKGDMSLIGPRPERPHFVQRFSQQIPGYELRLSVRPGITGLAQVYGRYSTSAERKLRFDLMYIYNYSFMTDIYILLRTVLVILRPGRSDRLPEAAQISSADAMDI
jgi:exopolysaccharide biosynthesis polyprenyl glycosylphosphotransferase